MFNPQLKQAGALDAAIVDGGPEPDHLVVLCHGFGAPGYDLVPLAGHWLQQFGDQAERFRFAFPVAPLSLADSGMPDARAWWPLNMQRLMQAVQADRWEELRDEQPPGLDAARMQLAEAVGELADEMRIAMDRVVLGGFSQGAMLATDTALRGDLDRPAALLLMSGTLICESQWRASGERLGQLPVLQSHGTRDPILPYKGAEWLNELLTSQGADVTFVPFEGPHTIPVEALQKAGELLGDLARR